LRRCAFALLLLTIASHAAEARNNRPRSPTPFDGTTWTIVRINDAPVVGSAMMSFHNNDRMQVFSSCEILMGGFRLTLFRNLRIVDLSPPRRTACLAEITAQDRVIHAILSNLRGHRKSPDGQRITLRAQDGGKIEATR
jgi:hypothetical protein